MVKIKVLIGELVAYSPSYQGVFLVLLVDNNDFILRLFHILILKISLYMLLAN